MVIHRLSTGALVVQFLCHGNLFPIFVRLQLLNRNQRGAVFSSIKGDIGVSLVRNNS